MNMIDPEALSVTQTQGLGLGFSSPSTGSAWKKMVNDTLDTARAFSDQVIPGVDSETLFRRAKRCFYGEGVAQNYGEALDLFLQAGTMGHAEAQFFVGESYAFGLGAEKNEDTASEWYRKAADLGNTEAMMRLGDYCHYRTEADAGDHAEEARWYQRAADLGSPAGMRCLGDCYHAGRGVEQDYVAAVRWFKKAAELGDIEACNSLGDACYYGRGLTQNYAAAVQWYQAGNKPAFQSVRYALALYCSSGPENHAEVLSHLRMVSDTYERCLLGCLVDTEDRLEAYLWFRPAAAQGDFSAQESLNALIPQMTSMEIQAGEALCREL